MSLQYVNSQINKVTNTIAATNYLIQQKEEEIQRLQKTKSELFNHKNDFQANEYRLKKPVLTKSTWHGELATAFDNFRHQDLVSSYRNLYITQLGRIIVDVERKIQELRSDMMRLQNEVSSLRRQLNQLYVWKRELIRQEGMR